MPADLKLMNWIKENRNLGREEAVARLKQSGHLEQDIIDSYNAVVQQAMTTPAAPAKRKEPWLAVILSFLIPGVGHIYAGAIGTGIVILLLYGFAWLLTLSFIGAILGVPMILVLLIWGMVGSYNTAQGANRG